MSFCSVERAGNWRPDYRALAMHEIQVDCYSGYRADERPLRFTIGGRTLEITNIDDRWYSPDATYFRVTASDGNVYVLRYDQGQCGWSLDAFRSAAQTKQK